MAKVEFLGTRFDNLDTEATARAVLDRSPEAPFGYVVTPNVDHILFLEGDEHLRRVYGGATLCVCDSRVLALLARSAGVRLAVAPGSDLATRLLGELDAGDRINVVGADEAAADEIRARLPGVAVTQHIPPMGLRHDVAAQEEVIRFVEANPARLTFFAVGSPQQEIIAHRVAERGLAVGTGLCTGAALNFYLGRSARAPRWMQALALEWAHRLAREPRRLARRYLVNGPRIFPLFLRWSLRRARR